MYSVGKVGNDMLHKHVWPNQRYFTLQHVFFLTINYLEELIVGFVKVLIFLHAPLQAAENFHAIYVKYGE